MIDSKQRALLFLFACIPARALIAYWVYQYYDKWARGISLILLLVGLGLVFADIRREFGGSTDRGAFGEKVYWWSSLHALLYFASSFMVYKANPLAWVPLALDVLAGLMTFLFFRIP